LLPEKTGQHWAIIKIPKTYLHAINEKAYAMKEAHDSTENLIFRVEEEMRNWRKGRVGAENAEKRRPCV
jgi:hypothetical protein